MRDKMLGRKCPVGPGGKDCSCCGTVPGRDRAKQRRSVKRRERDAFRRETSKMVLE